MTRHTREPQHLILHLYGSSWVKIYRKIRIKRRKKVVQKGSLLKPLDKFKEGLRIFYGDQFTF